MLRLKEKRRSKKDSLLVSKRPKPTSRSGERTLMILVLINSEIASSTDLNLTLMFAMLRSLLRSTSSMSLMLVLKSLFADVFTVPELQERNLSSL